MGKSVGQGVGCTGAVDPEMLCWERVWSRKQLIEKSRPIRNEARVNS